MSNDQFGKISSGVSKNTSSTNSNDNKRIPSQSNPQIPLNNQESFSGNLSISTQKPTDQNKKLVTFDVLATLTNNPSSSTTSTTSKPNLFERFCQEPNLTNDLIELGQAWLESVSNLPIPYLRTDGRWHYLDRTRKYGYKATLSINSNNTPYLKLKYNDFRSGGFKCYFDSHQALSQLYNDWKLFYGNGNGNTNSSNHFTSLQSPNSLEQAKAKYLQAQAERQKQRQLFEQQQQEKEAIAKQSAYEKESVLWDSLSSNGQSDYFLNKALPSNIIEPSIRYGKDFILAQIINIDGSVKGWQKISKDGTKKFTYGLEKTASFILLGQLPKRPKLVFVCEGLATGLTARLARPDVLVICALDAGNIMSVVQELRAKFGGSKQCKIIILADNDHWKSSQLHPITQLPIGNTGLIKANKTALKYRSLVATPNFDGLDITNKPTDFNDLLRLTNLSEVKRQLKLSTRANPTYAYTRAYETEKTRLNKLFSQHTLNLPKHKLISLNDKYLKNYPDEQDGDVRLLVEAMTEQPVTLLRSGMGSGKTELIRDFIKSNTELTSLYISPRITLSGNAAMRLDSEFYLDYKHSISSKEQLQETDHLAIVVNSLPMLIGSSGVLKRFDIIVLDEIEQLLRHLMSKIKNKKLVLECFYALIRQAKYLIVADAHLANVSLDFLSELRPKEQFLTVLNNYQVGKGKEVLLYQASGNVQMAALVELLRKGKVYITFNCKKEARAFYNLVKEFYENNPKSLPLSILYISGDNNGEKEVKEFFANPNQEASKYDLIISTPSLSSGVSIDIEHFTFISGIFTHTVNTPQDCQQALARVRNANTWHVFISDSKQSLPTEEEIIAAKWKHSHPFDQYQLMKLGADNIYGFSDPIYEKLCLNVERNKAFLANDFLGNFIKELAIAGYQVKYKDNDEIQDFAAKYFSKTGKVLEQKEYVDSVGYSKNLTNPEAKAVIQKGSTTLEEKRTLEKFLIKEFYRLNDNTNQDDINHINQKELFHFINKDERGELRKKISRLEIAMSSDCQILKKYQDQDLAQVNLLPDMRLFYTERHIFNSLLKLLGINSKTLQYNGLIYSKESLRENGFISWIETNRAEFSGIVSIPKTQDLDKDPLRFVSKLLKLIGLKQNRVGRASKGHYQIDTDQLTFIRQIVAKRSMASLVQEVEGFDEVDEFDGFAIEQLGDDLSID